MKSFTALVVIVALIAHVSCQEQKNQHHEQKKDQSAQENIVGSSYAAPQRQQGSNYGPAAPAYAPAPVYSAPSVPAPNCPRNYMFSCQPHLTPVPCSQQAAYGSAGAYSQYVPQYVLPAAVPLEY